MNILTLDICPMAKPRMTQRDKWNPSKAAKQYFQWRDAIRLAIGPDWQMPESNYWLKFTLPIPRSWTDKKTAKFDGQPHQQRPDKDNLEKAWLDAVLGEDCRVWDGRVTKRWGRVGKIEIEVLNG